jgi:large subunit ribosomal protein L25
MISLSAKVRKEVGRAIKKLRKKGIIPAVLYGPKLKNISLEVNLKEFDKVYKKAGESTLISLEIPEKKLESPVLIHDVQLDPITGLPLHVDFLQPSLKETITANVPLLFEGESKAVEDLEGTLVKNISEIEVRALPQNLPHEIKVNIDSLETFEDEILIKDLNVPKEVEILKEPDEVVALVTPPEKVEEELEKPIEEKVEEVEKVEEKKEEEVGEIKEEKPEEKSEEKND